MVVVDRQLHASEGEAESRCNCKSIGGGACSERCAVSSRCCKPVGAVVQLVSRVTEDVAEGGAGSGPGKLEQFAAKNDLPNARTRLPSAKDDVLSVGRVTLDFH